MSKCKHKWSYAAGLCQCVCDCEHCKSLGKHYLQPDGRVTSTPLGRGTSGKKSDDSTIEIIKESEITASFEIDGEKIILEGFLPLFEKTKTNRLLVPTDEDRRYGLGFNMSDLPEDLQKLIESTLSLISTTAKNIFSGADNNPYESLKGKPMDEIMTTLTGNYNKSMIGSGHVKPKSDGLIRLTSSKQDFDSFHSDEVDSNKLYDLHYKFLKDILKSIKTNFDNSHKGYEFKLHGDPVDGIHEFEIWLDNDCSEKLWKYLTGEEIDVVTESYGNGIETLPPRRVKELIETLAATIIKDSAKRLNQATLNTLANIINNNHLLEDWCKGYTQIKLTLLPDERKVGWSFEPPPNAAGKDFIERFITGRETLNGFLHRSPEIRIGISKTFFTNLKEPGQLLATIKAAVKYYDTGMSRISQEMMMEVFRSGYVTKQLISTTPLKGVITYPLLLLMVMGEIDPAAPKFGPNREIIKTVIRFMRMAIRAVKATKDEQREVIQSLKKVVEEIETTAKISPLMSERKPGRPFKGFAEAVEYLCEGGYQHEIDEISFRWVTEQTEPKVITEAPKMKRLKRLPLDIISYVIIEGEAIRDPNDKMMIVSYAYGKLEICDWYLELLEVGSVRYIVPHNKAYLEEFKRQMLMAIKKVMDRPVPKPGDPIIAVNYPKGYEG